MIPEHLMNTPRLFTALAEWGACLTYVLILRRRYSGFSMKALVLLALPLFGLYQLTAGGFPLYLWIPAMAGAILLMNLFLLITTESSFKDTAFCCIRAFVLAEFAASLHWQLYVWWAVNAKQFSELWAFISMAVLYTMIFFVYYLLEKEHIPKDERMNVSGKELFGAALTALGAFFISNLSFVSPHTPFSGVSDSILYVRTLVDLGGLIILFAQQDKREELRLRSENQSINLVLQRQYEQYRLSIDNMEMLRREFHDLKHYMIAIRKEQDPEKKEQYLLEMETAILTQEALSNTGNSVLDVILTTKSTYCIQNNIHFTCMADGNLISFMHVKDICSIFGNALDNAIECVSQYEDPEKRLVNLSMFRRNEFLMIQCENYVESSVVLRKNGLPSTTKADSGNHGYGLKSIQHAAAKYGGTMTLHSEGGWFRVQVLIPGEPSWLRHEG